MSTTAKKVVEAFNKKTTKKAETEKFVYIVVYEAQEDPKPGERFRLIKFPILKKTKATYFCYDPKNDDVQSIREVYMFDKSSDEDRELTLARLISTGESFSIPFTTKKAATSFMIKYDSKVDFENAVKAATKVMEKKNANDLTDAIVARIIYLKNATKEFNSDEFFTTLINRYNAKIEELENEKKASSKKKVAKKKATKK